jgi:hypothetical protein
MSSVPFAPIQRLIRDVTGDLHVVVAASQEGYRETGGWPGPSQSSKIRRVPRPSFAWAGFFRQALGSLLDGERKLQWISRFAHYLGFTFFSSCA